MAVVLVYMSNGLWRKVGCEIKVRWSRVAKDEINKLDFTPQGKRQQLHEEKETGWDELQPLMYNI